MDNFEEYLRQGEPSKAEKAIVWKTAIGLQDVDGLKPSDYLIATARQNIEGDITIDEVKYRIDSYYRQYPTQKSESRSEEADKVSARIAEILSEQTFTFSPVEYLTIHRRLFQGIYSHAGRIRDYNITKKEWVLNGETVLYASAESLKATLEYDFEQEKKFNYKGLNHQETIEHIASFITYLWQIHVFGEGNTRTTAVFLIKYLLSLGFNEVQSDLFAEHSWYFRNALVRANYENLSKGIYRTNTYLIRFFGNLLLKENHVLRNREMHVHYHKNENIPKKAINAPINVPINVPINNAISDIEKTILGLLKHDPKMIYKDIALHINRDRKTVQRAVAKLKNAGLIERVGSNKTGHWKIIEK